MAGEAPPGGRPDTTAAGGETGAGRVYTTETGAGRVYTTPGGDGGR